MKNRISFLVLTMTALFLSTACNNTANKNETKELNQQELQKEISSLEKQLFAELKQQPDQGETANLRDYYQEYAQRFPNDSLAPEYLFRSADLAVYLKDFGSAISMYQSIAKKYPAYARTPECLFLTGWVYDEHLKKYDLAKETYEVFIERYPESPFREAAEVSIQHLGKSPEEIMEEIMKKNGKE